MASDWEKGLKHIFVLTSAGKPIFTRHGDEHELVTTFGLLQAVASIVQDSGDQIHCIKSGARRIVYLLKRSLYFVAISSTGEPEAVLRQQLEFIHNQILFVLTSKIHDILASNPSKDVRELLGQDTNRLIQAGCKDNLASPFVIYNCLSGFIVDPSLRHSLRDYLKGALLHSNAAFGCLFFEDSLVTFATNERMDVRVAATDILLLAHFVHNSTSLRTHDQNWVPLCLPSLNSGGYVQAYIATLRLGDSPSHMSLVLISASAADADEFKILHEAKLRLQESIDGDGSSSRLLKAISLQQVASQNYLSAVQCLHFFFKHSPASGTPAQCIWGGEPNYSPSSISPDTITSIWTQCYRLGACLREGSSSPEITLRGNENCSTNSFSAEPAADHALAYATLDSGAIVVGLATSDSELYATFPGTVSALDGCGLANFLTRMLRKEVETLFQL